MQIPGTEVAIHDAAVLIEFGGSLVVVAGCLRAILVLARDSAGHGIVRARLLVADGVIAALGFKTAATLLKIVELQNWTAILSFAAIFALRIFVKRVLAWEVSHLRDAVSRSLTATARITDSSSTTRVVRVNSTDLLLFESPNLA